MFIKLFSYIFGNKENKRILDFKNIVYKINNLESIFKNYKDEELKNNTYKFKNLLLSGRNIDNLLPRIFANIKEAIKRVFKIKLFDVQLLGALALYYGCIAEMKTGEGKTITSTLPAYLYSLLGNGVHIITVNDYLAKRDSEYNSRLFNFLGLNVGLNISGMSIEEKKYAYLSDITYGTSNEYGFDYLRDNMILSIDNKVQRKKLYCAILDEIDSILIDEARTPLIISSSEEFNCKIYNKINKIILYLKPQYKDDSFNYIGNGDFVIDYKFRQVFLTERGIINVEKLLIKYKIIKKSEFLYTFKNIEIMHYIISLLKAHYLYIKNIDYLVKDNKIIIIDENTGRMVFDRRWSDGLHQAIEAKENVEIKNESKILASITFQNYFKLYEKICGMTGTAFTESSEFSLIYNLETIIIPTNKPMIRKDLDDLVYLTENEKIDAIIKDIKFRYNKKQPVLVGTLSIEKSEFISNKLSEIGIKHNILNAKHHMSEANIISQAGRSGSVTIATNMAGRGTDIVLGGNFINNIFFIKKNSKKINSIIYNWKKDHKLVVSLGGLHVIGTEKHESRRLDNQLRGRSGRQGDPGSSRFYISMDDSLMRIFSSKNVIYFMRKLGIKYGQCIEHPWISKCIEGAQKKIESRNFDIRKQLLEYDNVYNDQRKIIYSKRNKILYSKNIFIDIKNIFKKFINYLYLLFLENKFLFKEYFNNLNINISLNIFNKYNFNIKKYIFKKIFFYYNKKKIIFKRKVFNNLLKSVVLKTLDFFWKEYLYVIDNLKEGIHLCAYAQKNPYQEYKIESFKMFNNMLNNFNYELVKIFIKLPNCIDKLKDIIEIYSI